MFSLSKWVGKIVIMEPDKMSDLDFYNINNLPFPIVANGESILKMINENVLYSERSK